MHSTIYRAFNLATLTLVAFVLGSSSLFADFDLIDRGSLLNSSDFTFDGNDELMITFFDELQLGVLDESFQVGNIRTSQFSSIANCTFDILLSAEGGNSSSVDGVTEAINDFFAEFEVLAVSDLRLEGSLLEEAGFENSSRFSLTGPDTDLSFSTSPTSPAVDFDLVQTLLPGTYDLRVRSFSGGGSFGDPLAGATSADVSLSITSSPASVPEPSSLSLLFGLSLVTLLRRRASH